MKPVIKVLCLVTAFVLVSIIVGVASYANPLGLSGSDYTWRQQALIRMLNTPMPLLGAVAILLGLVSAFLDGRRRHAFEWWIGGAILLIVSGLITRFCSQPINAVVMTWDPNVPPLNWRLMRDAWWHWHKLRTVLSLTGFVALLIGYFRGQSSEREGVSG